MKSEPFFSLVRSVVLCCVVMATVRWGDELAEDIDDEVRRGGEAGGGESVC